MKKIDLHLHLTPSQIPKLGKLRREAYEKIVRGNARRIFGL